MADNDLPLSDAPGPHPNIENWQAGDTGEAENDTGFPDTGSWVEESPQSVQSLLYLVKPRLGGCPDPMIIQALRTAARRFCRDTEAWRERFAFPTTRGQTSDELVPMLPYQNVYIQRVISVTVNGLHLDPRRYRVDTTAGNLELNPPWPQDGQPVVVVASIMPTAVCDSYPANFLAEFSEGIVAAVLADLKAERNQPYSDPENAPLWESRYQNAIGIAKRDVITEHKAAAPFRAGEFY